MRLRGPAHNYVSLSRKKNQRREKVGNGGICKYVNAFTSKNSLLIPKERINISGRQLSLKKFLSKIALREFNESSKVPPF